MKPPKNGPAPEVEVPVSLGKFWLDPADDCALEPLELPDGFWLKVPGVAARGPELGVDEGKPFDEVAVVCTLVTLGLFKEL